MNYVFKKIAYLTIILLGLIACQKSNRSFNATISGTVKLFDSTGNRIEDASNCFVITSMVIPNGKKKDSIEVRSNCNKNGDFVFENLIEGTYNLTAICNSDKGTSGSIDVKSSKTNTAEIEIHQGSYYNYFNMSLHFVDNNGFPIKSGKLYFFNNPNDCKPENIGYASRILEFNNGAIKLLNQSYKDMYLLAGYTDASGDTYYNNPSVDGFYSNTNKQKDPPSKPMVLNVLFWKSEYLTIITKIGNSLVKGAKIYAFYSQIQRDAGDTNRAVAKGITGADGIYRFKNFNSPVGVFLLAEYSQTVYNFKGSVDWPGNSNASPLAIPVDTTNYMLECTISDMNTNLLYNANVFLYTSKLAMDNDTDGSLAVSTKTVDINGKVLFSIPSKGFFYVKANFVIPDKLSLTATSNVISVNTYHYNQVKLTLK